MKFSELATYCKSIDIDCDRCEHKNECSQMMTYTEMLSPYGILKMIKDDKEF
ncbi:MAG: hypothetical protein ACI37Z_05060 [Candidatus Gastranaerophilaceae bacterium]